MISIKKILTITPLILALYGMNAHTSDEGKKRSRQDDSDLLETESPTKKQRIHNPFQELRTKILTALNIANNSPDKRDWDYYNNLIRENIQNIDLFIFNAEDLIAIYLRAAQDGNIQCIDKILKIENFCTLIDAGIHTEAFFKAIENKRSSLVSFVIENAFHTYQDSTLSQETFDIIYKTIPEALNINLAQMLDHCINPANISTILDHTTATLSFYSRSQMVEAINKIYCLYELTNAVAENNYSLYTTIPTPAYMQNEINKTTVNTFDILKTLYDIIKNNFQNQQNSELSQALEYLKEMLALCVLTGSENHGELIFTEYAHKPTSAYATLKQHQAFLKNTTKYDFQTPEFRWHNYVLDEIAQCLAYDLSHQRKIETANLLTTIKQYTNNISMEYIIKEALVRLPYVSAEMLAEIIPHLPESTHINSLEEWVKNLNDLDESFEALRCRRARNIIQTFKTIKNKAIKAFFNRK